MAEERNYYVICEDKCLFPAMTKEQILAAIAQATGGTVKDIDDAFITKIKELNGGNNLKFWVGTTAEYNAIKNANELTPNCFYITTDDSFGEDIESDISAMRAEVNALSTAVTPLLYDSGWVQIKRYKQQTSSAQTVVGSYRIIGNMCTVSLQYNPAQFDSYSSGRETCPLPISLDIPTEGITVPVLVSKGDGVTVSYSVGEADICKNSVEIYGISSSGATLLQGIGVVFSLPKADEETAVG